MGTSRFAIKIVDLHNEKAAEHLYKVPTRVPQLLTERGRFCNRTTIKLRRVRIRTNLNWGAVVAVSFLCRMFSSGPVLGPWYPTSVQIAIAFAFR